VSDVRDEESGVFNVPESGLLPVGIWMVHDGSCARLRFAQRAGRGAEVVSRRVTGHVEAMRHPHTPIDGALWIDLGDAEYLHTRGTRRMVVADLLGGAELALRIRDGRVDGGRWTGTGVLDVDGLADAVRLVAPQPPGMQAGGESCAFTLATCIDRRDFALGERCRGLSHRLVLTLHLRLRRIGS